MCRANLNDINVPGRPYRRIRCDEADEMAQRRDRRQARERQEFKTFTTYRADLGAIAIPWTLSRSIRRNIALRAY